jgi:hypothetical protein
MRMNWNKDERMMDIGWNVDIGDFNSEELTLYQKCEEDGRE